MLQHAHWEPNCTVKLWTAVLAATVVSNHYQQKYKKNVFYTNAKYVQSLFLQIFQIWIILCAVTLSVQQMSLLLELFWIIYPFLTFDT